MKTNAPSPNQFAGLSVGEIHDSLWEKGIYTKSMIGQWYKCGIQTERRHVYGEKYPPGFVVAMGSTYAALKDVGWGKRLLAGQQPMEDEEARQFVSEEWARQMEHVEEPEAKDVMLAADKQRRIIDAYHTFDAQWRMEWYKETGQLVGSEMGIGYDGSVSVVDRHGTKVFIAGTVDMLFEEAVADDKFVGSRSRYRKYNRWDYEPAHLALVTGRRKFFLFPAIHDFARKVDVEKKDCPQGEDTLTVAKDKIGSFKRAIDLGLFPAPNVQPGTFPCHPKWCGYFGRTCPLTQHLRREDFE